MDVDYNTISKFWIIIARMMEYIVQVSVRSLNFMGLITHIIIIIIIYLFIYLFIYL